MKNNKALVIVDMQNDFCPGGALAVKEGDMIVPVINRYIALFETARLPVMFTRDWHPPGTKHFKKFGGLWPQHCVQNTPGAAFHPNLHVPDGAVVLSKGMDKNLDGYTVFQAKDPQEKGFLDILRSMKIRQLFIGGLATDYCVKETVSDALQHGYMVYVLADAIKGVDLKPGDSQKAINEMKQSGAQMVTIDRVEEVLKT